MKFFILLLCITLSVAFVPAPKLSAPIANNPAYPVANVAPTPPQATLAQDIQQLKLFIPKKDISDLILRHLLNDVEFQGVIRTINSFEASMAVRRFIQQPEVVAFKVWYRSQLRLSTIGSEEDLFSSEELELFNKSPYWANSVYGWQGFINEFLIIFPEYTIQQTIQTKLQQSPSFAEFWRRLGLLRAVFERFLFFPETQNVILLLQEHGVDRLQLENFIRTNLNWVAPPPVAAPSAVPAVPVEPVAPEVVVA